ncbi:DUF881 domain-containing protein [Oerskovia flava]|uniref:DUF881 domain-containing protein n=1 Tax=Oerskovia flava TaxID=2986422 RepID=UPI0022401435|nr:DUF881 domain-containing protein [Oerskovia sp. JB1-3-2]
MSSSTDPRPARPPVDASMTLLTEVMQRPLDPGYAEVASRRAAGTEPARGAGTRGLLVALAVLLGLVTASAAVDLRAPQPAVIEARGVLEQEITDRRGEVEALVAQEASLDAEIDQLQTSALSERSPELLETLRRDAFVTGSVAVEGPGVVITLRDASGGLVDPDAADPNTKVQDVDLQRVVNALWAAGAEAVAVNDQRLTPLSAIRSAGSAILVDLQPLIGPYRVVAIGSSDGMQTQFARSGTSDYLRVLSSQYGIQSSVIGQSSLEMPGGSTARLFYARPVDSLTDGGTGPGPDDEPDDAAAPGVLPGDGDVSWEDLLGGSPSSRSGQESVE